jgi:hypothetical protein
VRRSCRGVLSRWQGGVAALVVTLVTGVLVILEVTDVGLRRWWAFHALTTDTVAGLLVLLITVLVVDQVVRLRQINGRARGDAQDARPGRIPARPARRCGATAQDCVDAAAPRPRSRDAAGHPRRPIRLNRHADRVAVHQELPGRTGVYRPHPLKAPPRSIPPARLRPVLGCYACVGGAWWATLKRLSASRRESARGC